MGYFHQGHTLPLSPSCHSTGTWLGMANLRTVSRGLKLRHFELSLQFSLPAGLTVLLLHHPSFQYNPAQTVRTRICFLNLDTQKVFLQFLHNVSQDPSQVHADKPIPLILVVFLLVSCWYFSSSQKVQVVQGIVPARESMVWMSDMENWSLYNSIG